MAGATADQHRSNRNGLRQRHWEWNLYPPALGIATTRQWKKQTPDTISTAMVVRLIRLAGTLDAATGTLTLTDANGKDIAGTNVSDWASPQGVSTNVNVSGGTSGDVSMSGYGVGLLSYYPYANVSLPPATIRNPNAPPPLPKLKGWSKLNCLQSQTAAEYTGDGGGPQGASDVAPGQGGGAPNSV